jgi:hypothetical protein
MVLIASTKKLDIRRKEFEDFYEVDAFEVDNIIQDIRIEPRRRKAERLVKELDVVIEGEHEAAFPTEEGETERVILLSTDKDTYGLNERMTIAYAADANGYMALYYVNPEGETFSLKNGRVRKDKVYRLKAVTESPTGDHYLVSVFSEEAIHKTYGKALVKSLINEGTATKDIRLVEEGEVYKVHPFTIED